MLEPAVTLTDYLIALECLAVCLLLRRAARGDMRFSFTLMFAGIGGAALAGGTVHGFFPDAASLPHAVLWRATLIGIGVMAMAGWRIGAGLLLDVNLARLARSLASVEFALYALFVIFVSQKFMVAIVNYLPAALFVLWAFIRHYRNKRAQPVLLGIIALLLTFASSGVQMLKIGLHPVYLDHNVLYHLMQFVAIALLYGTARHFAGMGDEKV